MDFDYCIQLQMRIDFFLNFFIVVNFHENISELNSEGELHLFKAAFTLQVFSSIMVPKKDDTKNAIPQKELAIQMYD